MRLFEFESVKVSAIIEREGPQRKTQELFPTADAAVARQHFRELEPFVYQPASDRIYNTYQSFLVQFPGRNIIIDTCVGENKARPPHFAVYPKKPWLENLAATGLTVNDIDTVICTHLHVDHCGWNTRLENGRWVPTFPNARYFFAKIEYDYWEEKTRAGFELPGRIWTDSCLPIISAGCGELVSMNHDLGDGVWLSPTPGHTPGHVCVNVEKHGQRVVFTGDLMHHAVQCREPDWSSCFCEDPLQSALTRRKFLDEVAGTQTIVVPEHFPFPTAGRVERDGSRYRYRFLDNWWSKGSSLP